MSKKKIAIQSRFEEFDPDQVAGELTGQATGKTFTLNDATEPKPKDPRLTGKERAKFTTMLRPDLREMLDKIARNRNVSIADILETIIVEYFGKK